MKILKLKNVMYAWVDENLPQNLDLYSINALLKVKFNIYIKKTYNIYEVILYFLFVFVVKNNYE